MVVISCNIWKLSCSLWMSSWGEKLRRNESNTGPTETGILCAGEALMSGSSLVLSDNSHFSYGQSGILTLKRYPSFCNSGSFFDAILERDLRPCQAMSRLPNERCVTGRGKAMPQSRTWTSIRFHPPKSSWSRGTEDWIWILNMWCVFEFCLVSYTGSIRTKSIWRVQDTNWLPNI